MDLHSDTEEQLTTPQIESLEHSTESDSSTVSGSQGLEVFLEKLTDLMHHDNVVSIRQEQSQMMRHLEVANWKLASLNEISETTFNKCATDFRHHTKMLQDMKKQLDSIFRRIRNLKLKVATMYPEAYAVAEEKCLKTDDVTEND